MDINRASTTTIKDVHGNEDGWTLGPGEVAVVVDVDAEGDFRLRNPQGVESVFVFRRVYCYEPVEAPKPQFDGPPPKQEQKDDVPTGGNSEGSRAPSTDEPQ